ncbi:SSI family serine proteinase inhibitor [Pseudarthrobacter sp. Y6]|uniref:SSI family serine proteinase inhibitor n=1 Tax=Pseudarthrobacter sp. Y6 TaxID=3418422 RepID=UPI003CE775CC
MHLRTVRPLLAVLAVSLLAACTGTPDGTAPSAATPTASSSASQGTSDSPAPDTETTVPAPSPSAPPAPPGGPGAGNAELAIMVRPSPTETAVNYTLVCRDGLPTAESKHPNPEAACAALKNNAALLSPAPKSKDVACTEQYGGPQTATVTGIVDDTPVDAAFARTNGCEIGAWNAAQDVLGASGGAA